MVFDSFHNKKDKSGVSILRQASLNAPTQNANFGLFMNHQLAFSKFYHNKHFELISRNFRANQKTFQSLESNPHYLGNWRAAINHAWDYEKFDIQLGGRGSENWTRAERAQILKNGHIGKYTTKQGITDKVAGHHRSNKSDHPWAQSDASNIRFCRTNSQHLKEEHGGDFHNKTDGEWINRDKMVAATYRKQLLKREFYSAGIAAALGFATNASISLILELSENGLDRDNTKKVLLNAGKNGLVGARNGLLYYGGLRGGSLAIDSLSSSIKLSPKAIKIIQSNGAKIAIVSGVIITLDSIRQISNGMSNGNTFYESVTITAKNQIQPIVILGLSVWNLPAGVVAGLTSLGYDVWQIIHDKKIIEQTEEHYRKCLYSRICDNL